jgi:hypothetical protein
MRTTIKTVQNAFLLGVALVLFALAVACSDSETRSKPDASQVKRESGASDAQSDSTSDAGEDAAPEDLCGGAPGQLGGTCNKQSCGSGLKCMPASTLRLPVRDRTTGKEQFVDFSSLTGKGLCSKTCTVGADDCGACGKCTAKSFIGRFLAPMSANSKQGVCALRCSRSVDGNGGCPNGYTCAPGGACLNACTSDQQCRVLADDSNGDGIAELTLDSSSEAYCNLETGLCDHPSGAVGDSCKQTTDCKAYSQCMTNQVAGNGICVREYCNEEQELACGAQEVCNVRMAALMDLNEDQLGSMCLPGCQVGQEAEALRIGKESHGDGCPIGFACLWDGVSKADDAINGGCFSTPSHNPITVATLGALCTADSDCYSPWGLGLCRFSTTSIATPGICVVAECSNYPGGTSFDGILPGVASALPVCPAGQGSCVLESDEGKPPVTTCFKSCATASDCASGLACSSPFEEGIHVCWHTCQNDAECREGSLCKRDADGVACTGTKGEPCSCR